MDSSNIEVLPVCQIIEYLYDNFYLIVVYVSENLHAVCEKIPGLSTKMADRYPVNPLYLEILEHYQLDPISAVCDLIFNIIIPLHKYKIFLKAVDSPSYGEFMEKFYLDYENRKQSQDYQSLQKDLVTKFSESFWKVKWGFMKCNNERISLTYPSLIYGYDETAIPNIMDYRKELDDIALSMEQLIENIIECPDYIGMLVSYMPSVPQNMYTFTTRRAIVEYINELITQIIKPKNLWSELDLALRKCEFGKIIGRLPKPDSTESLLVPLKSCLLVSQIETKPQQNFLPNADTQNTSQPECCICYEPKPRLAGKECGHRCVCRECSDFFLECPICNCATTWMPIYES